MVKYSKNNQIDKFLAITSLICICAALMLIKIIPTATNYEISIYNVYPIYFWILLSIPISIAFLKVIIEEKSNYYTFILIGGALFSLFILLGLPFFRGYSFYGAGDTYTHLGMIKDIAISGHIGLHNPYPIIHLLIFSLSTISNLTPETISLFIPFIFIFLFIISMFLLSNSLGNTKKESLFVLLFSLIPALGTGLTTEYIMPSLQAFLYIPLILFIFFKSRNSNNKMAYSSLLVFSLVLMAFFHPEPLIFLTVFFVVLYIVSYLEKRFNKKSINRFDLNHIYLPIMILFVSSLAWFSSTYIFGVTTQDMINSILLNLQPTATPIDSLLGGFHISLLDSLGVIAKKYGVMLTYLIIGFFVSLNTLKKLLNGKFAFYDILLVFVFIAFGITNLLFLSKGTAIGFNIVRQLKYPLMISILILGVYFGKYLKVKTNYKSFSFLLIIISFTFILPIIAVTSIYPSPSIQEFNYEPMTSDIQGMNFFLDHRDENLFVTEVLSQSYQTRLSGYTLGYEVNKKSLTGGYNNITTTPPHFGYNSTNFEIGNYYQKSKYLLIYPPALNYYPEIYPNYPNLWKYTPADFETLENKDPSLDCLYSNGDFQIFIINPNKS